MRHESADWVAMAPHLPDPDTGSAAKLQEAADVMRARRLPDDALEYYRYALQRGGDEATLDNRIGITLLELHRSAEARLALRRAVQLKPKDARTWNNLGASEYVSGNYLASLDDYQHAVKLDKKTAVYRSNLGSAYFQVKDYESARVQFTRAIKLDPNVFDGGGFSGIEARVLSASDHGRFCFEMAHQAAKQHDDQNMLRWLARASESGFDIVDLMRDDRAFDDYRKDVRIAVILRNAKVMRTGQIADSGLIPPAPTQQ